MMYKNILSILLLTTITITCFGEITSALKIKQLKEARAQKGLELSDLGEKISETQALIEELSSDISSDLSELTSSMDLSDQEQEEFAMKLLASLNKVMSDFQQRVTVQKNINGMLTKIFFDGEKPCPHDFNKVKFLLVRRLIENNILKEFIGDYEECLKEFIQIDHEIDVLLSHLS